MFTIKELQFITNEDLSHYHTVISNVAIDGRKIKANGLYVPIKGENHNGHFFLAQAIKSGAIASLWDEKTPVPLDLPDDFKLIKVHDTLTALQSIASVYRRKINPIIIAITGSNGKTTTKDIMYGLLSKKYNTHKTIGNLNNHLGVPLTLLSMPTDTEMAVIEMGMSEVGEIKLLSSITKPDYAIITNIGESHLLQLGSRENIAKAKKEILEGLSNKENVFFDGDEPLLSDLKGNPICFGHHIQSVKQNENNTSFKLHDQSYQLSILGEHHAKNASYAIELAKKLDISNELILDALKNITFTGMRMEKTLGINESTLLNDTYNASPVSMKGAIRTVAQLDGYTKRILVLGDMLELGKNEEQFHREIAQEFKDDFTHIYCIGERARWIYEEANKLYPNLSLFHTNDKETAIKSIKGNLDKNTLLLAKASRGMKLDKLIHVLSEIGETA